MALNFDRKSLEGFQDKLKAVDQSWQSSFNLKEIIRQSRPFIKKAKSFKVSWEQIAALLQEATGEGVEISAASVRQYYFELSKKQSKKQSPSTTSKVPSTRKERVASGSKGAIVNSTMNQTVQPIANAIDNSFTTPSLVSSASTVDEPEASAETIEGFDLQGQLEAIVDPVPASPSTPRAWTEPKFNKNRVRPGKR